jgi:hypothetical protein
MRAKIKEGWYPYGVGHEVEVEKEGYFYKVINIFTSTRKNTELCFRKLLKAHITKEFLDFNYNNMKDTVKTFRVKIKDNHPNPSMTGLIVNVSLDERLDIGDRYKIESVEDCTNTPYDNYYIMDEYLDFNLGEKFVTIINSPLFESKKFNEALKSKCEADSINLNATNEYENKSLRQYLNSDQIRDKTLKKTENGQTRVYDSGAQRDGDANKPYTHSIQPYTRLRFGYHMRMGARKYGDKNYLKGFPDESIIESADRHWTKIMAGDMSEDNISAMLFAIQLLMLNQEKKGIKADHWFKREE